MNSGESSKTNALVLLSGGIDSAACAYFYINQGFSVETLFVDYGQKTRNKEAIAARSVADFLLVPFSKIEFTNPIRLSDGEIIGRNSLLLFLALMEFKHQNGIIGIGIHSNTPYYDCSSEFISKVQDIYDGYAQGRIKIGVPFLEWSKSDTWNYFLNTKIPFEHTYSCEIGESQPCGKCLTCKDLEKIGANKKNQNTS